jgi:hypothetical protein
MNLLPLADWFYSVKISPLTWQRRIAMNIIPETNRNIALSEHDMDRLHNEDLHAARVVVGLMTGVFLMGLLLYSFILVIVW